jgi:hypothetical protein
METIACPVCRGRISLWAIRTDFTCPGCHWWLRSNIASAMTRSQLIGVIAALLFLVSWYALGRWSNAFFDAIEMPQHPLCGGYCFWLVAMQTGVFVGLVAWVIALRRTVVLRPIKRVAQ